MRSRIDADGARELTLRMRRHDADSVAIEVQDTGVGIRRRRRCRACSSSASRPRRTATGSACTPAPFSPRNCRASCWRSARAPAAARASSSGFPGTRRKSENTRRKTGRGGTRAAPRVCLTPVTSTGGNSMATDSEPVSERIRAGCRKRSSASTPTTTSPRSSSPASSTSCTKEVAAKMSGVLESLVIDVEHDHNTRETARRVAKMYVTEVFRGRYVPHAPRHRISQRLASQRADDHGADHGAQRLQPSPVSDHGPAVDRRDAERAFEPDRAVEVFARSPTGS